MSSQLVISLPGDSAHLSSFSVAVSRCPQTHTQRALTHSVHWVNGKIHKYRKVRSLKSHCVNTNIICYPLVLVMIAFNTPSVNFWHIHQTIPVGCCYGDSNTCALTVWRSAQLPSSIERAHLKNGIHSSHVKPLIICHIPVWKHTTDTPLVLSQRSQIWQKRAYYITLQPWNTVFDYLWQCYGYWILFHFLFMLPWCRTCRSVMWSVSFIINGSVTQASCMIYGISVVLNTPLLLL